MLKYTKLSAIFGNENFFGVFYEFGERLGIQAFTATKEVGTMKKLLGLVIALCLIVTTAIGYPMAYFDVGNGSTVEAASNYSKGYYKVTPSEGLNLRAKTSTSSKSLALITKGTRLKVTKTKKGWGYTSYKNKKGWVFLKYTKYLGRYLAGNYRITADVGLCLRKSTSTSSKKLALIPYRKVVKVTKFKGSWGYTSYGGKSGWIAMAYAKATSAAVSPSGQSGSSGSTTTVTKYIVNSDVGLCLRNGPGTSYKKLAVIPYKTALKLSRIKGQWARTKYDGKTGCIRKSESRHNPEKDAHREKSSHCLEEAEEGYEVRSLQI